MSEYTPGPWEIQRDSGLHIYITQPQDKENRTAGYYAEVRRFTSDQKQVEANARLISAAPELLEALKGAVRCMETDINIGRGVDLYYYEKAKDAIAKAKGEQE